MGEFSVIKRAIDIFCGLWSSARNLFSFRIHQAVSRVGKYISIAVFIGKMWTVHVAWRTTSSFSCKLKPCFCLSVWRQKYVSVLTSSPKHAPVSRCILWVKVRGIATGNVGGCGTPNNSLQSANGASVGKWSLSRQMINNLMYSATADWCCLPS